MPHLASTVQAASRRIHITGCIQLPSLPSLVEVDPFDLLTSDSLRGNQRLSARTVVATYLVGHGVNRCRRIPCGAAYRAGAPQPHIAFHAHNPTLVRETNVLRLNDPRTTNIPVAYDLNSRTSPM